MPVRRRRSALEAIRLAARGDGADEGEDPLRGRRRITVTGR